MRTLVLIPATLAFTAACGFAGCVALGRNPHTLEMSVALAVALIASAAGSVPLILARHATQLGLSQASLVATALHLLVSISFAAAVILGKFGLGGAFLFWLMPFYWMSLVALVIVAARLIKSAGKTGFEAKGINA